MKKFAVPSLAAITLLLGACNSGTSQHSTTTTSEQTVIPGPTTTTTTDTSTK